MTDLTLRIGGEGGEGVISAGEILARSSARSGYEIFTFRTYPAEIRGGLAMFQLRVDKQPVWSAGDKLDVFMAFNQEALDNYTQSVKDGGVILYDPDQCPKPPVVEGVQVCAVPLNEISKEATDSIRGKNVTAVGVISYLLGIPLDVAALTVKHQFTKKGPKVVGNNTLALVAGFQFASEKLQLKPFRKAPGAEEGNGGKKLIMSGNQAVAIGALAAGIRFCAGYPITPATPIFEFLANELPRFGGHLIQCEDEISAIGACLGASYAGRKAITPTSGPGLALMGEFISLASMTELPLVIVDVQRSGPSTGMPTKTEQSDLNFAVYGAPGDAPRVVIAPSSVKDCFELSVLASNIAERYQTPVIMLSDASLAYRTETVDRFDLDKLDIWERTAWQDNGAPSYQRYAMTDSGVSPMATPGTEHGWHQTTGLEHDEYGHPNYSPAYHQKMAKKRYSKHERIACDLGSLCYDSIEQKDARIGIIGWGSTKGTVREAIAMANRDGIAVSSFHPYLLSPLPKDALSDFIDGCEKLLVVEENFSGQFAGILRSELIIKTELSLKCQGIPFTPLEIYEAILEVVQS